MRSTAAFVVSWSLVACGQAGPAGPRVQAPQVACIPSDLGGFWIATNEVTIEQWSAVMGRLPSASCTGVAASTALPVLCVSWHEATEYADALSHASDDGSSKAAFRLPSFDEWRIAAGDHLVTPETPVEELCHRGNLLNLEHAPEGIACSDGYRDLAPVGSFSPNVYGVHDMVGNVAEWVSTPIEETTSNAGLFERRRVKRVFLGGSFNAGRLPAVIDMRPNSEPENRNVGIGFRLARDGPCSAAAK